jgi:hypothetical protein
VWERRKTRVERTALALHSHSVLVDPISLSAAVGVKQFKYFMIKSDKIKNHPHSLKPLHKANDFNGFKKNSKVLSDNNDS